MKIPDWTKFYVGTMAYVTVFQILVIFMLFGTPWHKLPPEAFYLPKSTGFVTGVIIGPPTTYKWEDAKHYVDPVKGPISSFYPRSQVVYPVRIDEQSIQENEGTIIGLAVKPGQIFKSGERVKLSLRKIYVTRSVGRSKKVGLWLEGEAESGKIY